MQIASGGLTSWSFIIFVTWQKLQNLAGSRHLKEAAWATQNPAVKTVRSMLWKTSKVEALHLVLDEDDVALAAAEWEFRVVKY